MATGVAVALAIVGATPQPANAWSWSGTVKVTGTTGCTNTGGIQQITANGSLDGRNFSYSWTRNDRQYQVTFTNVRSGRVPSGGGWAWITTQCSMGGGSQGWVEMYRPDFGDTITKNL